MNEIRLRIFLICICHLPDDTTRKSVRVTGHHEYNSHDLERGPSNLKYYHLVSMVGIVDMHIHVNKGSAHRFTDR